MPDITMCDGKDCPRREQCYRFTATPTAERQSWFMVAPGDENGCDYFWPTEDSEDDQP